MKLLVAKEFLKNLSPQFVRNIAKEGLKNCRKIRNTITFDLFGKSLQENDIVDCLARVGVKEGDVVLVHSSLSRLGYVEGGAETVVSALLKAVGMKGTIGAPTFWGNTVQYLEGAQTFDVRSSPSILGIISETIRKHPDARRSLHPTHSAAFIGPRAEYLVKNHHLDDTPVGPNSPYMKLVNLEGKILMLGVSLEHLTNFNTIEETIPDFPVKVFLDDPLTFKVTDQRGRQLQVTTYCRCPEVGKKRQSNKMEPLLINRGVLRKEKLGHGDIRILNAKLLHEVLLDLYDRGITQYSSRALRSGCS
jgi:aminoglycoside 3-N-acetyltransferase